MANSAILAIHIVANANDAARGLRRTANAVRQFQRDVDTLSGGASGAFARIGGSIVQMGTTMLGATQAAVPLIGAISSIGLGAAGLAAVAAPAFVTMAIGFSAMSRGAKAFNEQFAETNALMDQVVGQRMAPMLTAFNDLKLAVSESMTQAMIPAFENIGSLLNDLTPNMAALGTEVGNTFTKLSETLNGPAKQGLKNIIDGSQEFTKQLVPGLQTLTQGFVDFGDTASRSAEQLGRSTGDLAATVGEKLSAVPDALFKGFDQALGGLDKAMAPLLDIFTQLGVTLGPVLGSVFGSIAVALEGMKPGLEQIGGTVGQAIVTVFEALAPVLPEIATAFAALTVALLPLIPPLAQFIASAGTGLAQALVAVAPLITTLATGLGQILAFLTPLAPFIAGVAIAWYGLSAALAAYNVIMLVVRGATVAWTAVQWALNVALAANPLGLLIAAIVIVIGIIVLLATKTQFFQTVWEIMVSVAVSVWNAILDAVQFLMDKLRILIALVKDGVTQAWEDAKRVAVGVWNAVKDAIQSVIDFVGRLIDKITGIRFPSPPGWMTSLFGGSGEAEFRFLPPDVMRFVPDVFQRFDAAPAELTAASSAGIGLGTSFSNGSSGNVVQHVTNVNIQIEGAIDPVATGNQLKKILREQGIIVGSVNARQF